MIEGWELRDLRVRQDPKGLQAHLDNQVRLVLESQEKQGCQVSQASQVCQVEMVPLAQWDLRGPRDTQVPQV